MRFEIPYCVGDEVFFVNDENTKAEKGIITRIRIENRLASSSTVSCNIEVRNAEYEYFARDERHIYRSKKQAQIQAKNLKKEMKKTEERDDVQAYKDCKRFIKWYETKKQKQESKP